MGTERTPIVVGTPEGVRDGQVIEEEFEVVVTRRRRVWERGSVWKSGYELREPDGEEPDKGTYLYGMSIVAHQDDVLRLKVPAVDLAALAGVILTGGSQVRLPDLPPSDRGIERRRTLL